MTVRDLTPKKSSSSSRGRTAEGRLTLHPVGAAGVRDDDDDDGGFLLMVLLEGRDTAQPSDDILFIYSNEGNKKL